MEHRWSARIPVTIKALIYHNGYPVAHCVGTDIGANGIFLKSGPLEYRIHTRLEVELELEQADGYKHYRLPAMVIQKSNEGMGLMFLNSESEASDIIQQLVYGNRELLWPKDYDLTAKSGAA